MGIEPRTIRRAVKDGPSDNLAAALLALMSETSPQAVHAEWIVGTGDDHREYLIHTTRPRFTCLVVLPGDDYDLANDDGIKYGSGDTTLAGFVWLDRVPDNLSMLMERACDALERIE